MTALNTCTVCDQNKDLVNTNLIDSIFWMRWILATSLNIAHKLIMHNKFPRTHHHSARLMCVIRENTHPPYFIAVWIFSCDCLIVFCFYHLLWSTVTLRDYAFACFHHLWHSVLNWLFWIVWYIMLYTASNAMSSETDILCRIFAIVWHKAHFAHSVPTTATNCSPQAIL